MLHSDLQVLRVVCRWDFNPTLAEELLVDIKESMAWLDVSEQMQLPCRKATSATHDLLFQVQTDQSNAAAARLHMSSFSKYTDLSLQQIACYGCGSAATWCSL